MARDQQSLAIPMRTSSVNAQTTEPLSHNKSQEELRSYNKLQKILGEIPPEHEQSLGEEKDKKRARRPSFMRAPEIKAPKGNGTFDLFPTPAADPVISAQHLRVRASSPLLGHEYHSHERGVPPMPQKKVHQTGSSNALYSYFSSHKSANESQLSFKSSSKSFNSTKTSSPKQPTPLEPRISFKEPKSAMKESKRKMRPPRIDLSLLFPKPKAVPAPLLSPQRMTNSPSPISVADEYSSTKTKRAEGQVPGKKLTKDPPHSKTSGRRPSHPETVNGEAELPISPERQNADWFDAQLERSVGCSEIDRALKQYPGQQQHTRSNEKRQTSRSNDRASRQEKPATNRLDSNERTARRVSSVNSMGAYSRETHLSPKAKVHHRSRASSSSGVWQTDRHAISIGDKSSVSKKSSKSTLKNCDLNISSVLCLSSSEDEADEEEEENRRSQVVEKYLRDSVTTYGEFDAEICTAEAAHAAKGPMLRRVERPISTVSTSSRGSRPVHRTPSVQRNPSMSSAGKSSYAARRTRSRRSSGIPTISEPDVLQLDNVSQMSTPATKEFNRRSRIMAVTRQEEDLLEAMRQRKGKITPSLFHEARFNNQPDPEQQSMLSVPSKRDSFYGSDISFLRLSPSLPPFPVRSDTGTLHMDKDGYVFPQGTASDAEQKTINSTISPRASLVYSESLPSPATSGASPLTPTLPIHRFSPLPHKPPRGPPPAVPQDQRRHSRRRTDSSEALVFDEADETKDVDEFPIWALGWAADRSNVTAVH